jgi:hypothetical protein
MTSFTTTTLNYPQLSDTPIRRVKANRPPTTSDHFNFTLGDEWLDLSANPHDWWKLVNKTKTTGTWILMSAGSGSIISLTGNSGGAVFPNTSGNVNVVGDGTTITIVGNPGTHTLTASLIGGGPSIQTINLQSGGTPIAPTAGAITFNGTTVTAGTNPVQTFGTLPSTMDLRVQLSQAIASTDATKVGLSNFSSAQFGVDANGFVTLTGGSGPSLMTLSDDVGTSITPSSGNIQLVGHINEQGSTKFSTVVAGTHLANINPMSPARWIVDPLGFNGTHTTIAAAITSATAGDTILLLPGVYTENPTLKSGVNITGLTGDGFNLVNNMGVGGIANVTILGKLTYSSAGIVNISNVQLKTNSDFILVVSGSAASVVNLTNCQLNLSNNTGISFTTSSSSTLIYLNNCFADTSTTGIALWSSSSPGTLSTNSCTFSNSGGSTTASTNSAGQISIEYTILFSPLSCSSTGFIDFTDSHSNTSAINTTCLTTAGTGLSQVEYTGLIAGTASSLVVGAGTTVTAKNIYVDSSNANTMTGGGTLLYGNIIFTGSSSGHNVTTETAYTKI